MKLESTRIKHVLTAIVNIFVFLYAPICLAQNTVGEILESDFRTLFSGCFGAQSYNIKFLPSDLTSHPMALEKNYKRISNVSFGALSTLVYNNQDFNESKTAGSGRFLSGLDIPSLDVVQDSYFSSLTYNFSCVSALKTALSAGLDPNPFFGKALNVQAGLNAEMNNKANTGLIILYGRFRSPFSAMLQDNNPAIRMRAYSAIWEYYYLNPSAPPNVAFLDFLEGWLVASTTAKDAARSLDVNASANANALVVDANWTTSASVKYSNTFKNQSFDIFLLPMPGSGSPTVYSYQMYALPKPPSIAQELQSDAILYPTDIAQIIPGQLSQFKIAIPGLGKKFCNTQQWDVTTPPPATVVNSTNAIDTDGTTCVINITMLLPPGGAVINSTKVNLTNNKYYVNGNPITFSKNILYQNSTYPVAHLSDVPKRQISGGADIIVSVDVPFAIETATGVPIPNDIRVTNANLDCQPLDSTKPKPATLSALTYSYISQPSTVIHSTFSYRRTDFLDVTCTWAGLIDFTYNGFTVRGKQINVPISLDHTLLPPEATTKL